MSKATTKMLVPKLRFPEFREAGAWEEVKLRQLGKLVSGLTYSPDDIRDNGLLVLRSSNVQNGEIALEDNVFVTPDIKGANLSQPNDILICVRNGSKALIGKNALIPEGMPLCTHGAFMTIFRAKAADFVFQLFQTHAYYRQVAGDLGATINSINGGKFIKYCFRVPQPKEQQKIADCLSSIDELITAHTQKHEALKAHKKGLMQQLFPADGETIPELRFPEFRGTGEWREQKLREVASFSKGKGISKSDVIADGKQPCIRYGELYTLYNETIENVSSYTNVSTRNLVLSKANDVIIPASGETQEDIATASCVIKDDIALGGDLNIIRSKMNGVFLSYYLNSAKKKSIAQLSQGISVVHLYPSQLKTLDINIPDLTEQQIIVDCLSSIDDLIITLSQKIEYLQAHKKGLMQQVFPAAEVVE